MNSTNQRERAIYIGIWRLSWVAVVEDEVTVQEQWGM